MEPTGQRPPDRNGSPHDQKASRESPHRLSRDPATPYLAVMPFLQGRERLRLLCALAFWVATYLLFLAWNQLSDFPHAPWQVRRLLTTLAGAVLFFGFTRLADRTMDLALQRRALLLLSAGLAAYVAMVVIRAAVDVLVVPAVGETPSTWPRHLRFGMIWSGYFAGAAAAFLSLIPSARRETADAPPDDVPSESPPYPDALWVSRGRETVRVPVASIDWVEAEGDYVRLHASGGGGLLRATLSGLEGQLDPAVFARVHRSAICRRSAVAAMVRKPSGALAVRLSGGQEVPVGRSYRDAVTEIIGHPREPRRVLA